MSETPTSPPRANAWRRTIDAPSRLIVASAIVLALVMVVWFALAQRQGHAESMARAERDTRNLAHLLSEHAARSFDAVDETLRAVGRLRADVARGIYRSQASIHVNLRTLHGGSPLLDEIGWLDAHGERVATSHKMDAPRVSMARQEFFRVHADNADDHLHVSRPTRSNGEAGWMIDFSRRLDNLDGSFAGAAYGTLDARRFVEVYAGLDLSPGYEITLLRGDGVLLARWPHDRAPTFQPIDQGIVPRAARGGGNAETYHEVSAMRRAEVIGSYAVVPRSAAQLVVDVNVRRDATLEPFWREFMRDAVELVLALAGLFVGARLLAVSLDRREALLTELAAANASAQAAEAAAARIARSEAELQRALEAEREMSAEQRRFIAIASHEFRTPLSIIDGAAQRLGRQAVAEDPNLAKLIARVRGGVTRMIEIIDRTLALSRMDQKHLELQGKIVDLVALVGQACAVQRARSPGFVVETALPPHPVVIEADPLLLDQAVGHLLSNAVKYSGRARRVDMSLQDDAESILLRVRDHGVGIPADEVPRLFTRYRRASTAGAIPGLGMGLCVVRSIARLHGGTVDLESVVGEGTTVTLRLPRRGVAAARAPIDAAAA